MREREATVEEAVWKEEGERGSNRSTLALAHVPIPKTIVRRTRAFVGVNSYMYTVPKEREE